MNPAEPAAGLLLFAHGARDPAWAEPFGAVLRHCRAAQRPAELAFLEFMAPNLLQAGDRLASAGCSAVDVVPLFLGAGGHVRKDIPLLLAQLAQRHPQVRWALRPAVGESAAVVQAMAEVALAAALGPEIDLA